MNTKRAESYNPRKTAARILARGVLGRAQCQALEQLVGRDVLLGAVPGPYVMTQFLDGEQAGRGPKSEVFPKPDVNRIAVRLGLAAESEIGLRLHHRSVECFCEALEVDPVDIDDRYEVRHLLDRARKCREEAQQKGFRLP